jgi:hypothetical protein
MNRVQLKLIAMGLRIEIKNWDTGHRMQLTRESSLNSLKRLTGADFGRGLKARQKALQWCEEVAVENGITI